MLAILGLAGILALIGLDAVLLTLVGMLGVGAALKLSGFSIVGGSR